MSDGLGVGLRKNSEYTAVMDPLGHNPLLAGMDGISPEYFGKSSLPKKNTEVRVKELEQSDLFKAPSRKTLAGFMPSGIGSAGSGSASK